MENMKKNAAPEEAVEKLSAGDIVSYGLGGAAATMPSQYKNTFTMNFLTDVAGLNIGVVGTLTMLLTIWDAINDPIIGGLADRTNTKRWGKYRPHMIMGCIMWAFIMMVLFFVPDISTTGKLVYYTIALIFYSVFYTQFTVSWQALNSVMSTDVNQRNILLTSRQLAGFISGALVGACTMPIVSRFSSEKTGFLVSTFVISAVCVITGLISANGAKKKDYYNSIKTPEKIHFKSQLNVVLKNRAVICCAFLLGLVTLSNAVNSAISLYYLKYVVKNIGVLSVQSILAMARSIIFIPMMPMILKKLGKIKTLKFGMLLNVFTGLCLFFLRENASALEVILMTFISGAGFTIANVACLSMIPDCTDYTELKFGSCQAGFINAIITFMKKFFSSFSTLIVGGLMGLAGYAANKEITPHIVNTIVNIKIVTPFILLAAALVILKFYPITPAYGREMRAKLKEIRGKR
ncbi:MFS transporter [uncultured Clostridium sp.]|uniref:MFS transporter n=1 Tax=uncultured Clostridium sp. TaxID=59620 RepID=UPI0025CBD0A6|nr:glycoside-pentoside-hexuronide (GPH):cation symporter [uncultured Clostridium sp.]